MDFVNCHFKWNFQLSKIKKILASARSPHQNKHLVGFNGFMCTFVASNVKKITIYSDFAASKAFWGTFKCLKTKKSRYRDIPHQN